MSNLAVLVHILRKYFREGGGGIGIKVEGLRERDKGKGIGIKR